MGMSDILARFVASLHAWVLPRVKNETGGVVLLRPELGLQSKSRRDQLNSV